jgi:hypothetical protein
MKARVKDADIGSMTKTKVCSRCSRRRPVSWYLKNDRYADGLGSHCRGCRVEMTALWKAENRARSLAWQREYEKTPEFKAARNERLRRQRRERARQARRAA